MKRYMLLPEDTIELLPQDGEAESAVSVFCERTLILFPCSKIESVSLLRNVREDRRKPEDCLCIRALDGRDGAQVRIFLDRIVDLGLAAHTGGVDEQVLAELVFKIAVDRVARRTGDVGDDHALFA